jgi:hypothetical protein
MQNHSVSVRTMSGRKVAGGFFLSFVFVVIVLGWEWCDAYRLGAEAASYRRELAAQRAAAFRRWGVEPSHDPTFTLGLDLARCAEAPVDVGIPDGVYGRPGQGTNALLIRRGRIREERMVAGKRWVEEHCIVARIGSSATPVYRTVRTIDGEDIASSLFRFRSDERGLSFVTADADDPGTDEVHGPYVRVAGVDGSVERADAGTIE